MEKCERDDQYDEVDSIRAVATCFNIHWRCSETFQAYCEITNYVLNLV